jgi:mRNA-degrading endonuclease toxin of MazEF toxin-antitoxin module
MTALIRRQDVFLVNFNPTVGAEAKKIRPELVFSNNPTRQGRNQIDD